MKLRKKEIKLPKFFLFLAEDLKISTEGLFDFLDSIIDALILRNASTPHKICSSHYK